MPQTPTIGRVVHYQSFGTPGGEYLPEPRAAIITEATLVVDVAELLRRDWIMVGTHPDGVTACTTRGGLPIPREDTPTTHRVSLVVLNPNGLHHNAGHDGRGVPFAAEPTPGHWNWPPRNDTPKPRLAPYVGQPVLYTSRNGDGIISPAIVLRTRATTNLDIIERWGPSPDGTLSGKGRPADLVPELPDDHTVDLLVHGLGGDYREFAVPWDCPDPDGGRTPRTWAYPART